METWEFDVLIAGAGPAGCSTAMSLARSGLKIALLDQATFPREKICGDGITIDVINQLNMLSPRLAENMKAFEKKVDCKGFLLSTPGGSSTFINMPEIYKTYIIQREYFDYELLKECKNYGNIHIFEDTQLTACSITDEKVILQSSKGDFFGKFLVGADGANSLVAKTVNPKRRQQTINALCVRAYYTNVKDPGYSDIIELHYLKKLLPGYFWIFHLDDNKRNVGLGMDERVVKKKRINLGKLFTDIVENDPNLKGRFEHASMQDQLKAYRIPVYNGMKKIYDHRVLLVGDAANMANPFTGEGVGNALRTGRYAAEQIEKCFTEHNFSKAFNRAYYNKIKKIMVPELNTYGFLARINKSGRLLKFAINNAFVVKLLKKILL